MQLFAFLQRVRREAQQHSLICALKMSRHVLRHTEILGLDKDLCWIWFSKKKVFNYLTIEYIPMLQRFLSQ